MMDYAKHAKSKKKTENISWGNVVESGATGNIWEDVPVPQGTYQGGSRAYHCLPAADWPASSQQQVGQLNNNN